MQKAGVVLMTNDFVSDGREGELLKLVLLLIKRGSHLFEKNKKKNSLQHIFKHASPLSSIITHRCYNYKGIKQRPQTKGPVNSLKKTQ